MFDAETRLSYSGRQGIIWDNAIVYMSVPAVVTIVLTAAAVLALRGPGRASRVLLWVGAIATAMLSLCGVPGLIGGYSGFDGGNLDPWAWAAHLVGMCLALPVVFTALWLHSRDA